jgi:uncharacterized DUF497 family protein
VGYRRGCGPPPEHGDSFQEAVTLFSDDRALSIDDPDHSTGEDRFVLLRLSAAPRALAVVPCYPEAEDTIRTISARMATRPERATYEARWRP